MYVLIGHMRIVERRDEVIEALIDDARRAVRDEPGCVRFDVIQDAGDPDRVWAYEVYQDEDAFQAHMRAPHLLRFLETAMQWCSPEPERGASRGSYSLWPPDADWK